MRALFWLAYVVFVAEKSGFGVAAFAATTREIHKGRNHEIE